MMPDNKPQTPQRPQGSQTTIEREHSQRDRSNDNSGSRQGMPPKPDQRENRRDDAASTRQEGQTAAKPGQSDRDERGRDEDDDGPIRSGDAGVQGDPAIKHDDDAAGTAPEKKGSPPKFPREVQPRSN